MEPEFLARLIERHSAALVLFARQWCTAPEDIVQEAFVKLAGQTTQPNNYAAWLYRVVRNGAIDAGRSEKRRKHYEGLALRRRPSWFSGGNTGLDGEDLTNALNDVPREQREIIVAHVWGALTFEQIAQLVGCSSSTAHRRYQEGLQALRERLEIECPNPTNRVN